MVKLWNGMKAWLCFMASFSAQALALAPSRGLDRRKAAPKPTEQSSGSASNPENALNASHLNQGSVVRMGVVAQCTEEALFRWINPYVVRDPSDMFLNVNTFEGLVVSQGLKLLPGLADRWKHSEDLKQWSFTLHPRARWSDGTVVRAQDFVLGWQTLCNPKTYAKARLESPKHASEGAIQSVPIRNASNILGEEESEEHLGVYAKDDRTLCFELDRPILPELLLASLSGHHFYPMRPEHVACFHAQAWDRQAQLPGCGAFALQTAPTPNCFSLKKNQFYRDKDSVSLEGVEIKLSANHEEIEALWKGGAIDLYYLDQAKNRKFPKERREQLRKVRVSGYEAIWLNHRNPWLGRQKVRKALRLLFHQERMVQMLDTTFWVDEVKVSKGSGVDVDMGVATRLPLFGLLPQDSSAMRSFASKAERNESGWNLEIGERKKQARNLLKEVIKPEVLKMLQELGKEGRSLMELGGKPRIALMLQHRYGERNPNNIWLLHHDLNSIFDLLEVRILSTDAFQGCPQAMELRGVFHPPHSFYRFTPFRTFNDARGVHQENLFGFHNQEYNQLLNALESGAGRPRDRSGAKRWMDEKLYRLDQIVRAELPVLPWREVDLQYFVSPKIKGLPIESSRRGDSSHHYSGALYFKYLSIREPCDQGATS